MTRRQWLLSVLIAWHLTAVILAALPEANAMPGFVRAQPAPGWRGAVTTGFDAAGAAWAPVPRAIGWLVHPLRPPFSAYIRFTGLQQTWAMFSNPPRFDQYMRVRYYVQPASGRRWMATQLVLPAHREDRVRLAQSYRDSYLDKLFAVALAGFQANRKPELVMAGTRPEQLPDDLAPIARYYSRIFARHLGAPGDRIVRTEVWFGAAPNTPPGQQRDEQVLNARRAVLLGYYEGVIEERVFVPPYPPYHAAQREADIEWLLEYFEES